MSPTTVLPVLPLPHPLILLPSARVALRIDRTLGDAILTLLEDTDAVQLILAAVPVTSSSSAQTERTLHAYGTAAHFVRLIRSRTPTSPSDTQSQPYLLTIQGLSRIRLRSPIDIDLNTLDSLPEHEVEYPSPEKLPQRETVEAFKGAALRLLDRLAKDAVQPQRRGEWLKFAAAIEDVSDQRAAWMADIMVAAVNGQYSDKLAFLAAMDVEDRLKRATEMFIKQASISEVSRKIATAVDESLSNQQKEYFLRQQMAAIQRELNNLRRESSSLRGNGVPVDGKSGSGMGDGQPSELDDDEQHEADDLAQLKKKIETMEPGSEERKVGVREWRRLKRIPQGSVENGVIRTYLEWLTSIPWPSSTTPIAAFEMLKDPSFLIKAREQLDADHYGLDQIKRRLIEYLAVVRLKHMNLVAESNTEQVSLQGKTSRPVETAEINRAGEQGHHREDKQQGLQDQAGRSGFARNGVKTQEHENALIPRNAQNGAQTPSLRPVRKGVKAPILLFVGPPGVGKTSLGQSIAKALSRPFQRISLGGVRDEAEIRGHRRTYVASGPGCLVQALRKAGRSDMVILLDEIDKIGQSNFHGDPAAALLEVLDPEQNHSFSDHYINVPVDLSQVLFICTSNTLETISAPLLDRCEIVELSGYTYDEKLHIAHRFLLPKQLQANGLSSSHLTLTDDSLFYIATQYTREAGVRSLERAIGAVVRYKAVEWAEHLDKLSEARDKKIENASRPAHEWRGTVEMHELEKILGIARWDGEEKEREEKRGVVYGLVVTGMGEGGILPVESTAVPGSGRLKLTGSLGDVIKESGEIALSWVKTHAFDLGITAKRGHDPLKVPNAIDIHLHLPAGAQKKDGPSAGIAMTCAFVSLLTGATVPKDVAMTGEITLRGRVTPVGGIRMKVLGAHRAQIRKIVLPFANRKDVEHDVALEVRREIQFVYVRTIDEALQAAFGKGTLGWRGDTVLLESRL